ncbi:hypothetical protein FHS21_003734 [Phyllobacterium trifolii]|jgi:hypothetical protein|uniref:Lectin-like protein BA14k n=1 Tax=Phyllobacterium trifolii TaxID=300193 RepID=A0A839U921_9HYPH|nr:BA14K family protein [Phyllobacterium trifolii]MBB3147318.1 hypothetical protein [Phyllobacterium trifolii]
MMKALTIILAALGFMLTTQLVSVSAQEIQGYRPAPRGLDTIPRKPYIPGSGTPSNPALRNCTGSAACYDFRVHRPIGPSGRTQVQRCRDQYQSYRAFDNTYQPFTGPRRRCDL